jgi:hypothetical protein
MVIIGETGDLGHDPGAAGSAKNVIGPVNLALIFTRHPRFEIRLITGDFFQQRPRPLETIP